ncbi:MAG: NAD(P)-dependent oxidoreductase [Pseudomonadales bacterium]
MTIATPLSGKKILITGPTGQVARPVVEALAKSNQVYALARFSKPEDEAEMKALGAETIKADLASDALDNIPGGLDYVLNYAVVKTDDFEYDLRANAEGVGRLMMACRDVEAFIHFSSTAVYEYAGHEPRAENSPLGDNHRMMFPTYSISKIAAETVARFVARQFDIPTTIARLSVPYGDNGGWPLYHLLMMQAGIPIDVHPDQPNSYNLLHAEDYIAKIPGLISAASSEVTTLNFGGSDATSIEEWCAYLTELTGFEAQFQQNDKAFGSLAIDTTRMHELIGETRIDWKSGVLSMIRSQCPALLKSEYQQVVE